MAAKGKEEKEEKKEEGAAEAAPPKKSKKKLFLILGVVGLLVCAGVPAFLILGKGKPADGAKAEEEHHAEKHLTTAPLDVFVVNLSENQSFLKVKMLLEYNEEPVHRYEAELAKAGHGGGGGGGEHGKEGAGLSGYLKSREAMIRDAVIRTLSAKRATEVLSLDGKEKRKEELIESINEAIAMDEAPVEQIYFAEFIIQ